LFKAVEDEHAQFTCKMVVANAGLAQRGLAGTRANAYGSDAVSHAHETLQKLCHVAIGETKVAMPPLALNGEQPRIDELGEVGTDACFVTPLPRRVPLR
jgi:hypothetical protein